MNKIYIGLYWIVEMSRILFYFLFNIVLYKVYGKWLFFSINLLEIGKMCSKGDCYE